MNSETKVCQNCNNNFTIESADREFYKKVQVPPPTFCPECRFTRRLILRNERGLYKRKCDLCGEEKIVSFPFQSPFKVYCKECWWSDKWDAGIYGREYDFSKPFFEQFFDLVKAVPRPGIVHQGMIVDSPYTNRASNLKNCYLLYASNFDENCSYGAWFNDSKDSMDGLAVQKSEQCYECIDCVECSRLLYSQECIACSNSYFLLNCRNCESCFGCVNLRNKSYCIYNKQYSKEDYKRVLAQFNLGSRMMRDALALQFGAQKGKYIFPSLISRHSQNVSGNWIEESKNVFRGFSCRKVEDARYSSMLVESKDVMDYSFWGRATELIYESVNIGYQSSNIRFSTEIWDNAADITYSFNCHSSHDLFGCVGLRKKDYCILNKQYSKEDFEAISKKIIEQMKTMPYIDGKGRKYSYGEFFPADLHLFAYNETTAHEYFPLTKEDALRQGYAWKDGEGRNYKITLPADQIPDGIKEVSGDILKEIVGCAHAGNCNHQCTTAFRVTSEELQFYKTFGIPIPQFCPNCRYYERVSKRNPLKLWARKCECGGDRAMRGAYKNNSAHSHGTDPCAVVFETSYAPDRPEIVYCENCYNAEVA
ncbi:MAG: hypothetical protein HYY10_04230 [Candidatus Liptonbacteria bacterium]|nr:hypothetical protein [Candidatus Liptonbacteria bacterium]